MTARSASLSAVSGNSLMAGCIASGNRDEEKKTPEQIHIGTITTFIRPETPSTVLGRLATSSPSPAKVAAPSSTTSATAVNEPRTGTPKTSQANTSTDTTSSVRKTSRANMWASM